MEVKHIQLCGREVNTIKKVSMHDDSMDFFYNYFEDDRWESAGFHKNSFCVYSNKIGWRHFHLAIVAAYVLEMIYLDGLSIPMVNGKFSDDLKKWFKDLRNRFDEITQDEIIAEGALKWIMGLMEYADDNYYRIFTINDFFEETLDHLNDCNYLKLWKIYDEILHDSEMEEAGSVIFVPDGSEYESMEPDYFDEQPYRRLITNWSVMDIDKRNNKARVAFRRYMALVANRKLRKKVFGF